jgi:hypothetical protein
MRPFGNEEFAGPRVKGVSPKSSGSENEFSERSHKSCLFIFSKKNYRNMILQFTRELRAAVLSYR